MFPPGQRPLHPCRRGAGVFLARARALATHHHTQRHMAAKSRAYLISMAAFWLVFGLGTTFYPRIMQLFMTPEGIAASTRFSDQVWLHGGMDILSVSLLLFGLSTVPPTRLTLQLAATVGLLPAAAMVYTLLATPFWSPLFLVPAVACLGFAAFGFVLASQAPQRAA
jgi:hypothetical protein